MSKITICSSCGTSHASIRKIRDGLCYSICGECGYCELALKSDISTEFERAQLLYHGENSAELAAGISVFKNEVLRYRASIIREYISRDSEVVEIGPGDGAMLGWFQSIGCHATAIEHSPHIAAHLRRAAVASVVEGDFDTLQFEAARFDAGCSFHVIEHVRDPRVHLRNSFRIVKPGGRFFVATPNARSWQHLVPGFLSPNFDSAHFRLFSRRSLRQLCQEVGWEVEREITPEFSTAWLRVMTKILRRMQNRDEESTAGQYSANVTRRTLAALAAYKVFATPFLRVQAAMGGGNELFFVLRRPSAT